VEKLKLSPSSLLVLSIPLIYLTYIFTYNNWAFEEIGHPFEKAEYTTHYYVNLFRDKKSSKNYRVTGEIEMVSSCDDEYGCIRSRLLRKATFPTGDVAKFDECFVELNKKEHCIDYDHDSWYVELTNIKIQ
jgi:hypothetical protein